MITLLYLIKSTLCLAVLLGFYKLALENKAMHQFKRYYLLASLVFAFTIPLITFTYTVEAEPITTAIPQDYSYTTSPVEPTQVSVSPEKSLLPQLLWIIYTLGVIIFGVRFILNLFRLKRKIETSEQYREKDITLALLSQSVIPHSFLKWIFLNKTEYLSNNIAPEVLAHEATHVRQKHSWDIIFIELLQVFFWFNPLIWVSKIAVKLNHEFLADQGAIAHNSHIAIYQKILLSYASSTHHTALESPFNYSLTKKRIIMLSQSFSTKKVITRALLLVPVLALCALVFNQAIVAQEKEPLTARNLDIKIIGENIYEINGVRTEGTGVYEVASLFNKDLTFKEREDYINVHIIHPDSVSNDEIDFLKKALKPYGYYRFKLWENTIISDNQEPDQLVITSTTPSNRDLENWQDTSFYGVRIDGRTIDNKDLLKYDASDFGFYVQTWLPKKAVYDAQHHVQVDLMTVAHYDKIKPDLNTTLEKIKSQYSSTSINQHSYGQKFVSGAAQNDKKALVIEIKNDQITINGKQSSLSKLKDDINQITANWTASDYKNFAQSFIFKGNTTSFLRLAEEEFKKTKIAQLNTHLELVPPPPPPSPSTPPGPIAPPPPPPPVQPCEAFRKNE